MEVVRAGFLQLWRDRERLRDLVIDANDGIVAIAGVLEGVLGAGLANRAAATAVVVATIAGAIAVGGSRYTEDAAEWDARARLLDEERHQLRRSPDQELDELARFYEAKGLAPDLARLVAVELTAADALAAHAEEEHGIEVDEPPPPPLVAAIASGLVFALGALVVVVTAVLTPSAWRVPTTFIAVTIALGLSSAAVARWGDVPLGRTVARNVAVGLTAMAVSFAVGSLIEA
ncbi:MAG TPA: VIT1/CCC1 transporter family protein [Acidimicrobiales bacterium]|nr:VIT1/CCC1 transporter family protein [Acidimicrobiales bacterium]